MSARSLKDQGERTPKLSGAESGGETTLKGVSEHFFVLFLLKTVREETFGKSRAVKCKLLIRDPDTTISSEI